MFRSVAAAVASVVLRQAASFGLEAPAIPVGAWYRSARTDAAYVRAVAQSLKDHHFNTVVANDGFTREMMDIFQKHGIAVVTRGDKLLDHPAVIGSVVGDEPQPGKRPGKDVEHLKRQYQKLRGETDKPLITCVVGDGLGVDNVDDPWKFWKGVEPRVRCLRWYGIARGHYGILHKRLYKGYVSYSSVLRIANSAKTPYWVVLPSFGSDERNADHQNPTPAQMRGMMHLAMAYGARGITFWALQDHADWQCLVASSHESTDAGSVGGGLGSLKPTDGKYAAAAEVAAKINAHATLIGSLSPRGGDIRCPSPFVEAVGQVGPDNRRYLYVVNKYTKAPVSTRLLWWGERPKLTRVRDLFSDEDLRISEKLDEEGYWRVSLALAPGEGKLLALGDGSPKGQPKRKPQRAAPVAKVDREPKTAPVPTPSRSEPVVRKEGQRRVSRLLNPWMGQHAKWEDALLGGKLLIDGESAYRGDGKLVGAYENENGAFAAWDVASCFSVPPGVKAAFITSGVMEKPRPLAIVLIDLTPRDGKEHTYEVHLPMASGLEPVRTLVCDLSQKKLDAARRDANAGNKLYMRHFRYFECYPRGRANYCADTVLRPAAENAPGWLTARVIEPWDGPVFPAAYRRPRPTGDAAASLVVSGRGKELRLKLLLFVDRAPADREPRIFTVWTAKNELRLGSDGYLRFRRLARGRTVFTFSSPRSSIAVGARDDRTAEDEMLSPD